MRFKSRAGDRSEMGVLSLLGELCPVEPQELGYRSVMLPRFVVLLLFSILPLSLKDLMQI